MHQNLLHSITCCWVVNLGVYADLAGHVNVAVGVDVDVADAVSMAQHRNLGVLLDVSHQGVAASGDDQVNDVIQLQQVVHIFSGGNQADDILANLHQAKTGSRTNNAVHAVVQAVQTAMGAFTDHDIQLNLCLA